MNNLGHLASELIALILHHVDERDLYACTLINKAFYQESMPLLWRHLDIYSIDMLSNVTSTLQTHLDLGNAIRSVTITALVPDTVLAPFIAYTPGLTHLRLNEAYNLTNASFQHVAQHCRSLTHLLIRGSGITLQSMQHLACPLESLTLDGLLCLDYVRLVSTPSPYRLFHSLQHIDLYPGNIGYSDDDKTQLAHHLALTLGTHPPPQLAQITLRNSVFDHTSFFRTVQHHHFRWPHLTHLHLDNCHDVDDAMVLAFVTAHTGMVSLAINSSMRITDTALQYIAQYAPRIQKLDVYDSDKLTVRGIYRFVQSCPTLVQGVGCEGGTLLSLDYDGLLVQDDGIIYIDIQLDYHQRPDVQWMAMYPYAADLKRTNTRRRPRA